MWDVQQPVKPNPPSLSQWLYQAIDLPGVRLRLRLRGNNLHVLLESSRPPTAEAVRQRVEQALQKQTESFQVFFRNTDDPVYKVILYGRHLGQQRPDWIESIVLADLNLSLSTVSPTAELNPALSTALLSNEHLARTGSPEAIARYLSESLSHLGVSVKVLVQKLPETESPDATPLDVEPLEATPPPATHLKRLWVICSCHYSPDASLIAEPIAQQLRDLELKGFKEAIIRSQVQGETSPDWMLQVDLTHPTELLWEWAKWGDEAAIARLLNQKLAIHHLDTRVISEAQTLHIFCRPLPDHPAAPLIPPTQATLHTVGQCLRELLPQGITAAALYGIRTQTFPQTPPSATELAQLQTQPAWVNWLPLTHPVGETVLTRRELARRQHVPALTFLLQRCLNPDIEGFLATGGIRVKLCFRGSLLHVMTEAVVCPRQTLVVPKLETYLAHLDIPGVTGMRIYGRRAGQSSPLWSYGANCESETPDIVGEAATPTVELVVPSLPTQPVAAPRWPKLRALLQRAFCLTSIFLPHPDSAWQPSALSRWHRQVGWPAAIAWSLVGLVGTGLVDWQLSRYLATRVPAVATTPLSLEMELPETPAKGSGAGAAILAAARTPNPTFNNRLLDEKLALYQERIRQTGVVPDILIVGSSRAMRGIDPQLLQAQLAAQQLGGQPVQVFNFGVNGATAQVVELLLRRILTPEQLPKLILWADGARAFNSGRPDRTFEAIQSSAGYAQLEAGAFHQAALNRREPLLRDDPTPLNFSQLHHSIQRPYQTLNQATAQTLQQLSFSYGDRLRLHDWLRSHLGTATLPKMRLELSPDAEALELSPQEAITAEGFLPLDRQFDPETYYLAHPRVSGNYDTDYTSFTLRGKQLRATHRLLDYLANQSVPVVLINLPVTGDYLDETRQAHEVTFTQKLTAIATDSNLIFKDWGQVWPNRHGDFSDPSHLNRYGAAIVTQELAADATLPWQILLAK
ncbi:MAG: DUF1574 domain-containing protein [Cyanobacteria bacterium P01_G01_bin.54]